MAFAVAYSRADRLFHRMAFATPAIQLTAADIERIAFGDVWRNASATRPVFVTSLARAGTTLLLEILHELPELACHTYRDMPFILAPFLWSKISRPFRTQATTRERAHGDRVQIGFDSPESFEEVFWKSFWPSHYHKNRICLWTEAEEKHDATAFFIEHMKKIIVLRRPDREANTRYLSKNNSNIARLPLLARMFPDSSILILLRDPMEHALSLHRQHLNFTKMQASDPFVKRYMNDIGHYEFADLHRPFAFEELAALTEGRSIQSLDYWLAYWIAAFEHVVKTGGEALIVPYEEVCANGARALAPLCEKIGIATGTELEAATAHIRPVRHRAEKDIFDPSLVRRAEITYRALLELAHTQK